jgi:diguanylate cyclase (GGDEF)-like protein
MTPHPSPRATRRHWPLRVIVLAVSLATVAAVALIGANAVRLGQVNAQVQSAQSRSLNLTNTLRETLLLLQEVSEFGESSTAHDIDQQRGLMLRQLAVSTASFPTGSAENRELLEIRGAVQRFPWARMEALTGRADPLRQLAVALLSQLEKRIHGLLVAQEKQSYAATTSSLDSAQRGQVASVVLGGLVLLLGLLGVLGVTRRSRGDLAVAYDQLQVEVMEKRAAEHALVHQAHHDLLTGLPNRSLLLERLGEALRDSAGSLAVLLVDLDGFKHVNDTLGHPVGDELLREAASRLVGCVREGDTAARLGGDEFAVLTVATPAPGTDLDEPALAVGRRIVEALGRPFRLAGLDVRVSASIGITRHTGTESADDLLRDADIAMYAAKNTGKGRVEVFDPQMRTRAARRTGMQQELARAVDLGEIEVHYQPIIDLRTLRPTTVEALARWRRDDRATVSVEEFIGVAEESGAILEIGREVLRSACRAVAGWRRLPGHGELAVAVNVAMPQVVSGRLVEHVAEALADADLPASALVLEITESAAMEESASVTSVFTRLRAAGVRIAVDDFGSGYSSLACLIRMPADVLKIDRTLLDFVTTRDGSLVKGVAELGRTLGLVVVVEGVETPDHLARAREAACDAAQGFHFARPLPAAAVPDYLRGWPAPLPAEPGAAARST